MSYKPETYTDVSPYLVVDDVEALLDFVEATFGAERLRTFRNDDGSPMHAEARIGDSVVMMGQMAQSVAAHVHVYVRDVHATYEAALAAGGVSVQEPLGKGDGDVRAGVTGPGGITWWPSTQMPDSPDEDDFDNVPV